MEIGASTIDATHHRERKSWVASAQGHSDFPIQNLPLAVFTPSTGKARGGVAIGDFIFDLSAAADADLFKGETRHTAQAAAEDHLNRFMAQEPAARRAFRSRLSDLLSADGPDSDRCQKLSDRLLHPMRECVLDLPAVIGSYTDFFAGIYHALNGARRRNPDGSLRPNYYYVPIAYHGRHSSVVTSGTDIRRPNVQRPQGENKPPSFGPTKRLDFELELGAWVGQGNCLGEPIPIGEARNHVAGFCLLNDWSARDTQPWESAPLGPFLAKSFGTVISPWVITAEALTPFAIAQERASEYPRPLSYLWDDEDQRIGAYNIVLEAFLSTPEMRERGMAPFPIACSNTKYLYWTVAQMVAHHSSNGCNLSAGDLIASGTVSGPEQRSFGSLNELTWGGQNPIQLPSGETRTYIEDGDEIILKGRAENDGFQSIGFGVCAGRIVT